MIAVAIAIAGILWMGSKLVTAVFAKVENAVEMKMKRSAGARKVRPRDQSTCWSYML